MALTQSFDVEFDDALLDLEGWKNPRYLGSKLTSAEINKYTAGDITYGLNPVIENKTVALYIGNTLIGGDGEELTYTEITNHSYATINKIVLIDVNSNAVQVIDRQNTDEIAFKRLIDRDLGEGSSVNIKLLDFSVENALKNQHFVKFNRGSLMKVYAYTANTGGFEDGVFGGHGVRPSKGAFLDNLGGSSVTSPMEGLFGFGMTAAVSRSLFTTSSIQFVDELPSELNKYGGEVNEGNLGSELNLLTQSFDPSAPVALTDPASHTKN
jgi:hypothetical protein